MKTSAEDAQHDKKKKEITHLCAPFLDCEFNVVFQDMDSFDCRGSKCEPLLSVQKAWSFTSKVEGGPISGMPHLITCTEGLIWVSLIEISYVLEADYHLTTLVECLEHTAQDKLSKTTSAILAAGDTVWCPFGYCPVILAIGPENDIRQNKNDELKYSSFVQYPLVDYNSWKSANGVVAAEVKSWLESGLARKLKAYKNNGSHVRKWLDALPVVACAVTETQKDEFVE